MFVATKTTTKKKATTRHEDRDVIASCSFCCKPDTEVSTLVAGPGVYICNECVDLSQEIIAHKPTSVARMDPWAQVEDLEIVLTTLPRVASAGDQVEKTLQQLVLRARELDATWARIGEALGMTRQSAWERFSGEE